MNTNILDYGAKGDGIALNTVAIQSAIDECATTGGGRITIPAGIYKSGTIWLRSSIELHLEMGAELLASDNMDDYNELDAYEQNFSDPREEWVGKHLIIAHEIENCAITGLGTINGNCHAFVYKKETPPDKLWGWCHGESVLKDKKKMRPGQLVCFIESKHIKVLDITIKDSPCWSCYLLGCEYAQIRGIKVNNPVWMLNSDGIDIDASRYVTVSDCVINTGDDAITLRGSEQRVLAEDMHCEHVTITNCVLSTGICAFRIGVGTGTIRHAIISNITVLLAENLVQFCTAYINKGGVSIEGINFSNISAVGTDRMIEAFAKNGTYIKNITMENIRCTSTVRSYIDRIEGEIDNISFRNVDLILSNREADMNPVNLKWRGNRYITASGVSNLTFENVKLMGGFYGVDKPVEFNDCTSVSMINCNFQADQ